MTYELRMIAYREGKLIFDRIKSMDSDTLACNTGGKVGREAFLELVNRWNKQGQAVNLTDTKYVYIAM